MDVNVEEIKNVEQLFEPKPKITITSYQLPDSSIVNLFLILFLLRIAIE